MPGNNPLRFIDPDGNSFLDPLEYFRTIFRFGGTSGKFIDLHIEAAEGNQNAQYMIKEIWINAGFEASIQTCEIVSQTCDGATLVFLACGFAPGAAVAKNVGLAADFASFGLQFARAIRSGETEHW